MRCTANNQFYSLFILDIKINWIWRECQRYFAPHTNHMRSHPFLRMKKINRKKSSIIVNRLICMQSMSNKINLVSRERDSLVVSSAPVFFFLLSRHPSRVFHCVFVTRAPNTKVNTKNRFRFFFYSLLSGSARMQRKKCHLMILCDFVCVFRATTVEKKRWKSHTYKIDPIKARWHSPLCREPLFNKKNSCWIQFGCLFLARMADAFISDALIFTLTVGIRNWSRTEWTLHSPGDDQLNEITDQYSQLIKNHFDRFHGTANESKTGNNHFFDKLIRIIKTPHAARPSLARTQLEKIEIIHTNSKRINDLNGRKQVSWVWHPIVRTR